MLMRKYFPASSLYPEPEKNVTEEFTMEHVFFAVALIAGGLIIAILVFTIEKMRC